MRHRYELLNVVTSNLIGTYPDQDSALDVIRAMMEIHGADQIEDVGLARFTLRGEIWPIAVGPDLVALAMSEPPRASGSRRRHRRRAAVVVNLSRGRVAQRSKVAI